jgi:predicted ArsR family transcriptional regulator
VEREPLSAEEFSAAVTALANAFGDPTRRAIYLHLRSEAGTGLTCTEVAEHFDLHPNVARHHLDKLAAGGYVSVELARGESAGRPSKRYQAREPDHQLTFPPRRDDLLATLLARSLQLLPPDQAGAMAEEVGYDYGRALAARMQPSESHRSVRTALASVADALTAHGFAAHAESRGGVLLIVAEQCPFGEAAQQFPHVVCAVDRGMIRGMMAGLYGETNPRFSASRPAGDAHCVACV